MLYFSQFFPSFFIGLRRICLCTKVRNLDFIACSVADRSKVEWISYIFMNEKKNHALLCSIYSPECWKSHFWALKFQTGFMPPDPCRKRGLVNTVGNSIQAHWLLVFLLKPLRGPGDIVFSGNMAHLDCERRTFLESFRPMILWESFGDWNSLKCYLVHSGCLNLANAWIPYWIWYADIFYKPQVLLWSKK